MRSYNIVSITIQKKIMKPSNKTTLPPSDKKGEIVLYQADDNSVSSILEYTAADVMNDI